MTEESNNPLLSFLLTGCALSLALLAGGGGAVLIYGAVMHKLAPADPETFLVQGRTPAPDMTAETKTSSGPVDNAVFEEGAKIYHTSCAACHQANGMGLPGVFPPLAGSDWVGGEDAESAIAVVLHGLQGPISVNGQPFSTAMVMPPQGGTLNDSQVAAVLTYVRNSWGNQGAAVPTDKVAATRARFKAQGIWTQETIRAAFPTDIHSIP